jgi:cell division protein FtsZ
MGGSDTLIIGVVTRPFNFEGFIRLSQAEAGIKEMRKYVDTLLVIPNENLYGIIQRNTSTKQAYRMADEVLRQAIQGISEVITTPGDVNVDFNDVKRIMIQSGEALIGMGQASGEKRHLEAAQAAITSPMLENADLDGAKGLIVHFLAKEHLAFEQKEVIDFIRTNASKDAIIMYGLVEDETMGDELKITVIATGFPSDKNNRTRRITSRGKVTMSTDFNAKDEPIIINTGYKSGDGDLLVPAYIRRQKKG